MDIFILKANNKSTYILGKQNVYSNWCRMQRYYDAQKIEVKVYSTYVTSFGRIESYEEKDIIDFIKNEA